MKTIFIIPIILGLMLFTGCNSTGIDNNSTIGNEDNLDLLNTDKPRITLEKSPDTGSIDIEINLGENTVAEYGYSAYDEADGDLSYEVKREHNIDFTKAGVYAITYTVEDSDGYTDSKSRKVTIVGNSNYNIYTGTQQSVGSTPQITFSDGDTIYLGLGQPYNNATYRAYDLEDGDLTNSVQVEGNNFDVNTAGVHTITYTVMDRDENTAYANRTVYVGNFGSGSNATWYNGSGGIDDFKNWYSSVCGQSFNSALYNANTGRYSGTISCSSRGLSSVDLSSLSIFSTIDGLDLSNNNLSSIDFNELDLAVNNVKILKVLDLSHNNFSYIDFTPLHNLRNINELWINGNNLDYSTVAKREALYRIFNNRSLTIYF